MNWRDPKRVLPEQGQRVFVMLEPHKRRGGMLASAASIEIVCGEARHHGQECIVDNNDELGMGGIWWTLRGELGHVSQGRAVAWIPVEEMVFPSWLK